jgi:hypothetical protein
MPALRLLPGRPTARATLEFAVFERLVGHPIFSSFRRTNLG